MFVRVTSASANSICPFPTKWLKNRRGVRPVGVQAPKVLVENINLALNLRVTDVLCRRVPDDMDDGIDAVGSDTTRRPPSGGRAWRSRSQLAHGGPRIPGPREPVGSARP